MFWSFIYRATQEMELEAFLDSTARQLIGSVPCQLTISYDLAATTKQDSFILRKQTLRRITFLKS